MLPSTMLKTHKIVFSDRDGRNDLPISTRKADTLKTFLHDRNTRYIDLTDDDGNYVETLQKSSIKSIQKYEQDNSIGQMRWVCNCGRKNQMHIWPADKCECRKFII